MKLHFFLASLLCTGQIFAYDDCVDYTASCSVLLLKPGSSNLYYGAEATPLPIPSPNWKSLEIRPDYHPGFELGIEALCCQTGYRWHLNWQHLHSSDTASKHVPVTDMVGPYFNIGPDASSYKNAHGHVKHEFDSVDLRCGRQFFWDCPLQANFFAGLSFARIKQTMTSHFSNNAGTITKQIEAPSLFTGAGPELGADFAYNLSQCFAFTGAGTASLLAGVLENSTTFLTTSPLLPGLGVDSPNRQTTQVPDRTELVPAISAKLGFSYKRTCGGCLISIGFGYQAQAYVNAIQSVDMSSEVTTPPEESEVGVFALSFKRTTSNFFLSGPYLNFDIVF